METPLNDGDVTRPEQTKGVETSRVAHHIAAMSIAWEFITRVVILGTIIHFVVKFW